MRTWIELRIKHAAAVVVVVVIVAALLHIIVIIIIIIVRIGRQRRVWSTRVHIVRLMLKLMLLLTTVVVSAVHAILRIQWALHLI